MSTNKLASRGEDLWSFWRPERFYYDLLHRKVCLYSRTGGAPTKSSDALNLVSKTLLSSGFASRVTKISAVLYLFYENVPAPLFDSLWRVELQTHLVTQVVFVPLLENRAEVVLGNPAQLRQCGSEASSYIALHCRCRISVGIIGWLVKPHQLLENTPVNIQRERWDER